MSRIADVCVIGTGAAGGVWIDECTRAGLSVVALERGPNLGPTDFVGQDELTNQHRNQMFAPEWLETIRSRDGETAKAARLTMLAHCVGGGTAHWGTWSWRFRPDEFRVLSTEGPIEGANLADWPVSYDELEPYYEKAERACGIAGNAGANPFGPPRKTGFPNPPHPPRAATLAIERAAKALGYHPFPTPMAINSRPYDGRAACLNGGLCSSFGCPVHAKASTLAIHVPRALGTGRLDLRADERALELVLGEHGAIRSVRTLRSDGGQGEVRARQFALAAGSLGTPQLLLLSRSTRFPTGLANGSDQVGRNLMFHRFSYVTFELPEPSYSAFGPPGMVAIDDLHPSDSSRGFVRGAVIAEAAEASPIWASHKAAGFLGRTTGAWGADLKAALRRFPYLAGLVSIGEDLPRATNRIDLDPEVVDGRGIPVPRITHESHPNDDRLSAWFEARMLEIAAATGAVASTTFDMSGSKGASGHLMGTCRMGDDAASSVVRRDGRAHEVPNLWISDGSVFPTSAGYNPTLTIFANSYRVVDGFLAAGVKGELS